MGVLPGWLRGKKFTCAAEDAGDTTGSSPGSGRSPGWGHGNPLQYSCLENPTDRGDWHATVIGSPELDTAEATEHTGIAV